MHVDKRLEKRAIWSVSLEIHIYNYVKIPTLIQNTLFGGKRITCPQSMVVSEINEYELFA